MSPAAASGPRLQVHQCDPHAVGWIQGRPGLECGLFERRRAEKIVGAVAGRLGRRDGLDQPLSRGRARQLPSERGETAAHTRLGPEVIATARAISASSASHCSRSSGAPLIASIVASSTSTAGSWRPPR